MCCSVQAPTSISPKSMIRAHAFAIGLSDYLLPVMLTRTIALPAVRMALAQVPARPPRGEVRSCSNHQRGDRLHHLLVRVWRRTHYESSKGGPPVCHDQKGKRTLQYGTLLQGGNLTSWDFDRVLIR